MYNNNVSILVIKDVTWLVLQPLRDIACVSGQPARFECIVLAEPVPSVSWSKDGVELLPSSEHQIEYRNGVCRLVLLHAKPCNTILLLEKTAGIPWSFYLRNYHFSIIVIQLSGIFLYPDRSQLIASSIVFIY